MKSPSIELCLLKLAPMPVPALPLTPKYLPVGFTGTESPPPTLKLNISFSRSWAFRGRVRPRPASRSQQQSFLTLNPPPLLKRVSVRVSPGEMMIKKRAGTKFNQSTSQNRHPDPYLEDSMLEKNKKRRYFSDVVRLSGVAITAMVFAIGTAAAQDPTLAATQNALGTPAIPWVDYSVLDCCSHRQRAQGAGFGK